jgi:hypothetical protein
MRQSTQFSKSSRLVLSKAEIQWLPSAHTLASN